MSGRHLSAAIAACAVCAAGMAGAAFAQDNALGLVTGSERDESADAPVNDRVVTRARRMDGFTLEEYVAEFVGEIAKPVTGSFGIARWDRRLCVGAMNVSPEAAQFVVNRVSDVAREVGLEVGEPDCSPDIFFIFTEDGPGVSTYLVDTYPQMFRPYGGTGGTTQGLQALEEFKTSDAPVRWWQITMVTDWGGNVAISLPNSGPPVVTGSNSRISNATKDEIWRSYVVVDLSKATHSNWSELADYLAVISLAQIDPEANTSGFDTILNLFSDTGSPGGMTDWDLSFLRALYKFDQLRKPRSQAGVLSNEMKRDQIRISDE